MRYWIWCECFFKFCLVFVGLAILFSCANQKNNVAKAISVEEVTYTKKELQEKYCGNRDKAVKAFKIIAAELNEAWDEVLGEDNTDYCSFNILVTPQGDIIEGRATYCYSYSSVQGTLPQKLVDKILEAASPITVPPSKCELNLINTRAFRINYIGWTLGW